MFTQTLLKNLSNQRLDGADCPHDCVECEFRVSLTYIFLTMKDDKDGGENPPGWCSRIQCSTASSHGHGVHTPVSLPD